jgi:hypothetical protein
MYGLAPFNEQNDSGNVVWNIQPLHDLALCVSNFHPYVTDRKL